MNTKGQAVAWMAGACLSVATVLAAPAHAASSQDWPMFGWDVARTSAPDVSMSITSANLKNLKRQQVRIDGTVGGSAIYLHDATVKGATHDVFFATTSYGKTLAIDADHGTVLWEFTPSSYDSVKGTYRITTATPVADADGKAIYAASPDGVIRRLAISDGHVEWSTSITRLPEREKITSPLGFFKGRVIATTGGYDGDAPPYEGHVAILDAKTGKLLHVWNALCSDQQDKLLDPRACPQSGAAIWGRAGAVIDAKTGNIYVATGNALWDGDRDWGDAVIELNPDATKMLGNYTPTDTGQLAENDEDVGSTSPVLAGEPYIVQGGKDGTLRVLDWQKMAGSAPHKGGATSHVETPGGTPLFTAVAMWRHAGASWLYVADNDGTAAWTLHDGTLHAQWHNDTPGTSPVVVDGMAFVYDPNGGLNVYDATSGRRLIELDCGGAHFWNSPIVADGRIALPQGNANDHETSAVFNIWRLPSDR
ncbi:MAG: PQQ-binding-like beta-propeller repeat protein [Rhodanobacteraceae bacterium]